MMSSPHKPLSALLSQILVAYTVEIDCDFELRMLQTQARGARLLMVIWLNLLRFLAQGPVSVRTLASCALTTEDGAKAGLGCLERWGVITLQPGKRAGFGSGRGIRADWPVRLTDSGETVVRIWSDLIPAIDGRWSNRFGGDATRLRRSLEAIEHQIDLELPQGLPVAILKLPQFGPRETAAEDGVPLPVLLSRVLLAFALDFERESQAPQTRSAFSWTLRPLKRRFPSEPAVRRRPQALAGSTSRTSSLKETMRPAAVQHRTQQRVAPVK
jgi:hypothetical protein